MISVPSPTDTDASRPWGDLLQRRCGLALREPQLSTLAGLVPARMRARGLATCEEYYELLEEESEGGNEWTELIDQLVSHETSFFRHPPSFEALRTHVFPELRRRPDIGHNLLSLWSAGCSTGEEAYSLAMTAMSDPSFGGEFLVWGADISRRTVETARRGRYSEKSVSAIPAEYRRQFVRAADGGRAWDIDSEVCRRVRFLAINLYSACDIFLNHDVVFCQNVLIYFAPPAVTPFVAMLGSRLTLGGYLLLGPGEAPLECPAGLEPVALPGVRAFRRVGRVSREVRP
jgi:chemotaxis methyl-accepting protein methylase